MYPIGGAVSVMYALMLVCILLSWLVVVSQPLALAAGLRGADWPLGRHPGHGSVCDVFSVYHARHYQGN